MIRGICITDCKTVEDFKRICLLCEDEEDDSICCVDGYLERGLPLYDYDTSGSTNSKFMYFWSSKAPDNLCEMTVEEFYKLYDTEREPVEPVPKYEESEILLDGLIHTLISSLGYYSHLSDANKVIKDFMKDKVLSMKPLPIEPVLEYQWLVRYEGESMFDITDDKFTDNEIYENVFESDRAVAEYQRIQTTRGVRW